MERTKISAEASQARIVPMEPSDLDEVARIETFSSLTSWSLQAFLGELSNPLSFCFCLKWEKEGTDLVLRFICFRIVGEDSEILNLGIHPQCLQQGMGRSLVRFYLDFCRVRNVKTFYLETGVSNEAAIRLYQSYGYRPAGIRSRLYPGKEDALLMVRETGPGGPPNHPRP